MGEDRKDELLWEIDEESARKRIEQVQNLKPVVAKGRSFEHAKISANLSAVMQSPAFAQSERLQRFLSFVVDFHLNNPHKKLSSNVIATECFGRDFSTDPNDPYVRNIASKTRHALKSYYASLDEPAEITIQLADKGYQPNFRGLPSSSKLLPTLAVLPFNCLAGDAIHGVVGPLLSGALITNLAKSRLLNVISQRTSSIFAKSEQSTQHLSQSLGVDYIVEGRYVVRGDKIRLNIELSSRDLDEVIWADQVIGSVEAVVSERDDLMERILSGVANHLLQHEVQRALNSPLQSLQCHSLLIASVNIMHRGSLSDFTRAEEMLQLLLKRNPHHATPNAHLAYWGVLDWVRNGARAHLKNAGEFVQMHADRALTIDAQHSVALTAMGSLKSHFEGDFESASEYYEKAILYSPNEASAMGRLSVTEVFTKTAGTALSTANKAIKLSPFDPELYFFRSTAATAAFGDKQYDESIANAEASYSLFPKHPLNLRTLIAAHTAIGNIEQAEKYKKRLLEVEPDFNMKSFRERSLFLPKHEVIDRLTHLLTESGLPATHEH